MLSMTFSAPGSVEAKGLFKHSKGFMGKSQNVSSLTEVGNAQLFKESKIAQDNLAVNLQPSNAPTITGIQIS